MEESQQELLDTRVSASLCEEIVPINKLSSLSTAKNRSFHLFENGLTESEMETKLLECRTHTGIISLAIEAYQNEKSGFNDEIR